MALPLRTLQHDPSRQFLRREYYLFVVRRPIITANALAIKHSEPAPGSGTTATANESSQRSCPSAMIDCVARHAVERSQSRQQKRHGAPAIQHDDVARRQIDVEIDRVVPEIMASDDLCPIARLTVESQESRRS